MGARILPTWLDRTVDVVQVRFMGELAQVLSDLVAVASANKSKVLPTNRLKASLALALDGIFLIDRQLGLNPDRPKAAIELYTDSADDAELVEGVRACLKTWNNDVVQPWAQANGFAEAVERLSKAITPQGISVSRVSQPLVVRAAGARLGKPVYHLIARRLAEELVGATLFEGMSPVDLVVDPTNTTASVELLTHPVRMEGSRNMFSMAARLSVFTMPSSRDLFVKVTPVKRIWSSELPGRKLNAPSAVTCSVMVPNKPFLVVKAVQSPISKEAEKASPWRFSDEYEEFLHRSEGKLPGTLKDAVAEVAPDPSKGGWWVGFPRLTTLFDRIGGRTVFERDEYDLHEAILQMLPWALDAKLDVRRVKAIAQKAAAKDTHTALKPSDIGRSEDSVEPGYAGQALLEGDPGEDNGMSADASDSDAARLDRLAAGRASNVAALKALYANRTVHLFVFGGEEHEQAVIRACAGVLFGDAVQVHTEALPLHTHGLKADLEKAAAKSLERFQARVARWEAAFKQLPHDGGVRHVMICADRLIGRRVEDPVNYYAAIHAACQAAGANVHHVLPIQQKRGKDDLGHFVHRVQSAMLDVFLAHSGVILGVNELVAQTIGQTQGIGSAASPKFVVGIQALRSRARRRSAESDVTFILYSRLSLQTGLVDVRFACHIGKKDTTTDWMDLASGLRWIGSQRQIASDERWIQAAFPQVTRSVLAQLKTSDERAIVLIDWARLKRLWPTLTDENLRESTSGTLMLGTTDLSVACPNMTFIRLRSSRETSMTIRTLVTKLYSGFVSNGQSFESTGEAYTERFMSPAHEIVEVLSPDAKDRERPGRTGNRHYLQVMRYRSTVQLQRGYSCYRSTERMKKIDGADKAADASSSKRFRLVQFPPMHDDAALPATTEATVIAGPDSLDADQVVRLVMGLRLRYAHYPDWTALPAPLFFITKVDDYVIPYADLIDGEAEGTVEAAEGQADDAVDEIATTAAVMSPAAEDGEAEAALPDNHDQYFDDITRAIGEQLPQLKLFQKPPAQEDANTALTVGAEQHRVNEDAQIGMESGEAVNQEGEGAPQHGAADAAVESGTDDGQESEQDKSERRPKDEDLAKAWALIQHVPCLYSGKDLKIKRLYEEMMRDQVRIHVDLPWFINVNTVVPADAWPDHKTINKFWRVQGNVGLRQPNKAAPSTAEFKRWFMRRLRLPQSCWSVNSSQLFKDGVRVFDIVFNRYDALLQEYAAEGLEPPELPTSTDFNSNTLARWLREKDDDEGIAWLIARAAHWPSVVDVECIFEALDGMILGPMARCALEYLVDCCEVASEAARATVAERKTLVIHRKRDPKWEQVAMLARQAKAALPAAVAQTATTAVPVANIEFTQGASVKSKTNLSGHKNLASTGDQTHPMAPATPLGGAADTAPEEMPSQDADVSLLREQAEEPEALLRMMADAVSRLKPGSPEFPTALSALRDAIDRMNALHTQAVEARERIEQERRTQLEREEAKQADRLARELLLQGFFNDLHDVCASIPEELTHEPHTAPGSVQDWLPYALSISSQAFDEWMKAVRAELTAAKEAAGQIVSTHTILDRVDNGTDDRLATLSGLARRQLQHKLQDELIAAADQANRNLSMAISAIADLGPERTASSRNPPDQNDQAGGAAVARITETTAQITQAAAVVGPVSGSHAAKPVASDATAGTEAMAWASVEGNVHEPVAEQASAAKVIVEAPAVTPAAVEVPPITAETQQQGIGDSIDEEADLLAEVEPHILPIEVDAEFDVRTLGPHLEPLQRAAADRLWKLTKVGISALCAVNPDPTVELHGAAWTSMLDSLLALTAVSAEQRLNDKLLRWLETGQQSVAGDGNLAFAMDVAVLGAGLLPILFEGHEAKVRWAVLSRISARLQDHKPLHDLCTHLQSLDSSSFTITRENLSASRVGPRKALEAEVLRQRDRAGQWPHDQALFSNWPNPEYWEMHNAMFDDRHGMHFYKALQHVSRGSDEALRKLLPDLRKYLDKIAGTLGDLRKRTGRKRPLEGPHADKLAQNVATTIRFLENYLELSSRLNSESTSDTPKPLRDFLDQLHAQTLTSEAYLGEIAGALTVGTGEYGEDCVLRLSATLAQQVLQSTLSLMNEQTPQAGVADNDQVLLMDFPLGSAMSPVWSVRLELEDTEATLRDPLAAIAEVRSVQEQLANASQARPQQSIEDMLVAAADMHRKNGAILAARAIEQRMRGASTQLLSQIQSANDAAHRKFKNQLSEELSEARQRVTNALSVGPMTQAEASRMLKVIEVLDRANRENQIGAIATAPTPYEDYPQARAILRHHITDPLDQRIHESLRALKNDIDAYREKVDKMDEVERARKSEQIDRILAGLKDVTPTNIRVARYSFSLLEQDQLPLIKIGAANAAQRYEQFQRDMRGFSSGHSPLETLRDALRGGDDDKHWPKGQTPTWAESLTHAQSEDAAAFIDAWIALTEARTINEIHDPLAEFFTAAGTAETPVAMSEPGSNGRTAFHLSPKTFVGSARVQNFWVPPTLGSAARDLRGVVLRHRPAPELVAQIIGELPMNTPTFVLGRTHLSLARRSAITRDHPVVIVDDDLVAYMAVHPEQRLAKMMEVGLLTFHANPYDDYGGPVPSEMFFGRRSEIVRLNANKSAMVLYGGRRLGKSSLLDRIQIESRQNLVKVGDETRGEVAIYIPLESRIDSAVFGVDHKLFAWMGIYRAMVANGFIQGAKLEPRTADGLREHIRSEIMANRALTSSCYLLIDEADEVMARDIEGAGAFATSLRALTDEVRDVCQIRYVIAGLHNLTRMHTEGNTALAKADVIALQPFSSGQDILMGVDLITKPLAALGFVFSKGADDLPMRILAMCNFYPAFVQLYCKNLIQDLYNKRGNTAPVTHVEATDLDKVERNKDFIGVMQEKFRYNLDLDKRYKAIALVLADTYYSGSGSGLEHGLTATEIRDLCQTMFPNHFSKTGEGAFPALLDEMEKLTVIDRKGGRFQLRTPHIATMMGSRDDVDHKIDELERETAPSSRIPGETRPFLMRGNGRERQLFPMPSGWVRQLLHEEERNLTVLVGNHLSGLTEIENLKQPWNIGHDAQYEVKFFANADSARPYINSMRRATGNDATNRIVAVTSRSWKLSQLGEYTALANSLARPLATVDARQRPSNVRLMLIANPQQALELAQLVHAAAEDDSPNGSVRISKPGWRVQAVPPWNDDAVYYQLKQVENQVLPDQPNACRRILEATLGFGGELSKLLRSSLSFDGIARAQEEIVRRIAPNRHTFYEAIGWPSSLAEKETHHIEEMLALLDGEKRSDASAASLASACGVTAPQLTFVRWMGLLQESGDGTWCVPSTYKALIQQSASSAVETGEA